MEKKIPACKKLIEESRKGGFHRNTMKRIKEDERIEDPNILEQHNLCNHYWVACHIPFSGEPNPIRKCCEQCELHQDPKEVFDAIHSGKYGEIIWGRVYK